MNTKAETNQAELMQQLQEADLTYDSIHYNNLKHSIGYWRTAKRMAADGYTLAETSRILGANPPPLKMLSLLELYEAGDYCEELPSLLQPQAH